MEFAQIMIVILLGIVEGITEWLPISSTGHMILVNEFFSLKGPGISEGFTELFIVVIQLGAIMAVVLIYWKKLWPFTLDKKKKFIKPEVWQLWFRILVACIPFAVLGLLFDDIIDEMLGSYAVVAVTLILYGIFFIIIEKGKIKREVTVYQANMIGYRMAFFIGLIQVLSMIPGTSRSGVTIIGAMLLGASRLAATEFTFYLAIPAMVGASLVKIVKYGFSFTSTEIAVLVLGMLTAFVVSVLAIRFLVGYLKKHNFVVFGWYRIVLGVIVLIYFGISSLL